MSAPDRPALPQAALSQFASATPDRWGLAMIIPSLRLIFRLTLSVVVALAFLPQDARAAALRKVTIVVDWVPDQPHHFAYWLAKSHGWYADNGLDVTIHGSRGSSLVVQLVVANKAEFGNIAASALVEAVAKQNAPLKMVAVYFQKDITAMAYFTSTGIKSLKDFEGRTMGIVPGTLQYLLWPTFANAAGIDASKVRLINSNYQLILQQWGTKHFDILGNYLVGTTDSIRFQAAGEIIKPVVLSDYLPLIGHGVVASTALIEKEPQTVKAFVTATQKAWDYMAQQPEEATQEAGRVIAANVENVPPADVMGKFSREVIPSRMFAPSTRGRPLGWSSATDWQRMIDILAATGDYPHKPTVSDVMTNQFVEK